MSPFIKTTPIIGHLIEAMRRWFIENNFADMHIQCVTASVQAPELTKDWTHPLIKLNISPGAVRDFAIGDKYLSFGAWKNGVPVGVLVPLHAIYYIELPVFETGGTLLMSVSDLSSIGNLIGMTSEPEIGTKQVLDMPEEVAEAAHNRRMAEAKGVPHLRSV